MRLEVAAARTGPAPAGVGKAVPAIVFGAVSLLGALSCAALPETRGLPLAERVAWDREAPTRGSVSVSRGSSAGAGADTDTDADAATEPLL